MRGLFRTIVAFIAGWIGGRKGASVEPVVVVRKSGWKAFFKRLFLLLPVALIGGVLLAASGLIPIKASSGHWGITRWFLDFSKQRSVAMHSIGLAAPDLDDRALVVKGAGHFDRGCRPCHGDVRDQPLIPRVMTPHAPYLPPEIGAFDPEELFYIVRHGIKFTGMPAWPTRQRDDEVWAVVAFLLELQDMKLDEYQALVHGPPPVVGDTSVSVQGIAALGLRTEGGLDVPDVVESSCGRCHGLRGRGREVSAFPRLAGQRRDYLDASLRAYARGERYSGIMEPIAVAMTEEQIREVAAYYADLEGLRALETGTSDSEPVGPARDAIVRGRDLALSGDPMRKIPSCADCHGPSDHRRNPSYPLLAGQFADYLQLQLELFQEGQRGGAAYARVMHAAVPELTEEQMSDVAAFYESLEN